MPALPFAVEPKWDDVRGFCLIALRDIVKGTAAFAVPEDVIMSVSRAREDLQFGAVLRRLDDAKIATEAEVGHVENGNDGADVLENKGNDLVFEELIGDKPGFDGERDSDLFNQSEDDGLVLFLLFESLKARIHGSFHRRAALPTPLPPSLSSLEDSFWRPYFGILPSSFPTSPIYWSDEQLEQRLAGSPLLWQARAVVENLRDNWKAARQLIEDVLGEEIAKVGYGWDEFLWAYMVVQTRGYKVTQNNGSTLSTSNVGGTYTTPIDFSGQDMFLCLMPFADFANHSPTSATATVGEICRIETLEPSISDDFSLPRAKRRRTSLLGAGVNESGRPGIVKAVAKEDKMKGEEVVIHYNDLANWQLLLYYGFSIPNNPFDRVNVELDVDFFFSSPTNPGDLDELDDNESPQEQDPKKLLLFHIALDSQSWCQVDHSLGPLAGAGLETELTHHVSPVPDSLVATLRLLVATPEELEDVTVETLERFATGAISSRNELATVDAIEALVGAVQGGYTETRGTSLEYEQISLTNAIDRANNGKWEAELASEVYALHYVVGQRAICAEVQEWVSRRRDEIAMGTPKEPM
ncbi:SET domain-containing protein 4 [Gonapodya sp. JEL0774]|nr:SET domain-containing protein 4 [Gonapodya sp. JEL0774]